MGYCVGEKILRPKLCICIVVALKAKRPSFDPHFIVLCIVIQWNRWLHAQSEYWYLPLILFFMKQLHCNKGATCSTPVGI